MGKIRIRDKHLGSTTLIYGCTYMILETKKTLNILFSRQTCLKKPTNPPPPKKPTGLVFFLIWIFYNRCSRFSKLPESYSKPASTDMIDETVLHPLGTEP
jgi:hypothetical protein